MDSGNAKNMKKLVCKLTILSCIVLTGCFPTGELSQSNNSAPLNNTELNASPREELVYNLSIPNEYVDTYSPFKCRMKQPDSSFEIAEKLFPGSTVDTTEILDRPEEENYKLYQKSDSFLCFQDGRVYMNKPTEIEFGFIESALDMAVPYTMLREEFPQTNSDSLPIADYVSEMDRIINEIGVEVGEPKVFAFDKKTGKYINKKYFPGVSGRDFVKDDCCIIKYDILANGLPLADYHYYEINGQQEWVPRPSSIKGYFDEDGMLCFDCDGLLDNIEADESKKLCTPEFAIQQIKDYFEKTTREGTLCGCEQAVLLYQKNEKFTGDYYARPVWVFGWTESGRPIPDPYYVDAITGHIF